MARNIYIGVNDISRKVTKLWTGVNNKARKVKEGYVGINGIARLFYKDGYLWNRYNNTVITEYNWNYYTVETKYRPVRYTKYDKSESYISLGESIASSIGANEKGAYRDGTWKTPRDFKPNYSNVVGWYYSAFNVNDVTPSKTATYRISSYIGYHNQEDYEGIYVALQCYISEAYIASGDYKGTVTSTSSSTYPSNGASGNYYYVSTTPTYKDAQGSFVGTVETESPTAYTVGVKNSDGYWYTKNGW